MEDDVVAAGDGNAAHEEEVGLVHDGQAGSDGRLFQSVELIDSGESLLEAWRPLRAERRKLNGTCFSKTAPGSTLEIVPGSMCVDVGAVGELASCYGVNLAAAVFWGCVFCFFRFSVFGQV